MIDTGEHGKKTSCPLAGTQQSKERDALEEEYTWVP